jgi:hypothetical protein|tara:strand:- start:565 stop:705 length:141 start_codon:yes stop_codon:yes gene_type:complete
MKKKPVILVDNNIKIPSWYCLKYEALYKKVEPNIKLDGKIKVDITI